MNDHEKSDGLVLPAKPPNNAGISVAEAVEGRRPAKGNAAGKRVPTQSGSDAPSALDRVRFSYGFRPGRSAHDAVDALGFGIDRRKLSWGLDADIRDFFGQLDHDWLMKFLEHRIADRRVLRLILEKVGRGVIEDGIRSPTERGTAPGASGIAAAGQRLPALRL